MHSNAQNINSPLPPLREEIIPFVGGDGFELNLIHVRGEKPPSHCPVILVHGAGVRANIFRAPVKQDIVSALIEAGYDVWLENWRASIDLKTTEWSLDQAAAYDHPYAVKKIIEKTGATEIKAIVHCQGSTSFTMSAIAGLVPQVSTIISNAVSLHPVPPPFSAFKLKYAVPFVNLVTPYLNPYWGVKATGIVQNGILALVKATHHECDNNCCKMVSFSYGTGFPALWLHENLNEETHEWLKNEFKNVPLHFFRYMHQYVTKGNLLGLDNLADLPRDFAAQAPKTNARFVFFTGDKNLCFLPESQRKSFQYFNSLKPDFHAMHEIRNYSHLDLFMGKNAYQDVFPIMIKELEKGETNVLNAS